MYGYCPTAYRGWMVTFCRVSCLSPVLHGSPRLVPIVSVINHAASFCLVIAGKHMQAPSLQQHLFYSSANTLILCPAKGQGSFASHYANGTGRMHQTASVAFSSFSAQCVNDLGPLSANSSQQLATDPSISCWLQYQGGSADCLPACNLILAFFLSLVVISMSEDRYPVFGSPFLSPQSLGWHL